MNCCNDFGQCTRGPDCPARPSCDELAVCQDREPACKGCPSSEGHKSAVAILDAFRRSALKFLPEPKP